jgi:hypothetical protein
MAIDGAVQLLWYAGMRQAIGMGLGSTGGGGKGWKR